MTGTVRPLVGGSAWRFRLRWKVRRGRWKPSPRWGRLATGTVTPRLGRLPGLVEEIQLRGVGLGEGLVLAGGFAFAGGLGLGAGGVLFEVAEDFLGAVDDGFGEARQLGDLDAVGFVGGAGEDFAEEDDVVVPFADGDVVVFDGALGVGEVAELVVVGGEEGAGLDGVVEVFGDGPGDGEAVEGGGAAADFVEDDEGAVGGVVDDEGGLVHLDHEGGLALGEVVGGADPAEDAVDEADVGRLGGDEGADLGHEGDEGDLADVGRLAGHVGAGEDDEAGRFGIEQGVVGDELLVDHGLFEDGVAAVDDVEVAGFVEGGAGVLVALRGFGEAEEDVEGGEGVGGLLEGVEFCADRLAEFDELLVFELFGSFLGAEDLVFDFLEAGRDIALGVGHGLLALVVVGDLGEVGFCDFDEVAEDVVELDLEGIDAGALAFGGLEVGDPAFAVARGGAEFVEFGGVAVADDAAVLGGGGWFVGEGGGEEGDEGGEFLDAG